MTEHNRMPARQGTSFYTVTAGHGDDRRGTLVRFLPGCNCETARRLPVLLFAAITSETGGHTDTVCVPVNILFCSVIPETNAAGTTGYDYQRY